MLSSSVFSQTTLNVKVLTQSKVIKPGEPFTLFIDVRSGNTFEKKVEIELLLPDDWQIIMSKKPAYYKGEAVLRYIYTVAPSNFALSGLYNVGVRAFGDGYIDDLDNYNLEILKVRRLDILTLETPEYAKEGDTLRLNFLIQNSGNIAEKIAVKSLMGKIELPSLIDSTTQKIQLEGIKKSSLKKVDKQKKDNTIRVDSLLILPNESMTLRVVQEVPVTQQTTWTLSSKLLLMMSDSTQPILHNYSVPIFSAKSKKSDPYLRFPLSLTNSYSSFIVGGKQFVGYQYDLRGEGSLDFSKKHYLSFIAHGPNRANVPALGSYDIYSLNYVFNKKTQVILGDYNLTVSNLLEYGRYGRGFKIEQHYKKIMFNAFYTNPRFSTEQKQTYGGVLSFKPNENYEVTLNYLNKSLVQNSSFLNADLISVVNRINTKKILLENEISTSIVDRSLDYGFFNKINFRFKKINFSNYSIYTTKNFNGYFRDSYQFINSINYTISKTINLFFNSNVTRLNPNIDQAAFVSSPFTQSNLLGLNVNVNRYNAIQFGYENRSSQDKSSLNRFNYAEQFGRVIYSLRNTNFNLSVNGRLGVSQNFLVKTDSSINRRLLQTSLDSQVKLFYWLSLGGYINYQRTSVYSSDNKLSDLFFYGGSTKVTFSNVFSANLNYRNNYTPEQLISQQSFLDLSANLKLGNHEFMLSGGKSFIPITNNSSTNIEYYALSYKFSFNAPIARNHNLSSVRGHIYGINNNINTKGMIMELGGKKVMADENGRFQINDLSPDKYHLNLIHSSLAHGIVSAVKIPLELNLKADSVYNISIPLVRTSTVLGKVLYKKSEVVGAEDIFKSKPILIVKLYNDKESLLTQVNAKDEFSFKEIKPGEWKIAVTAPGKSEQFNIIIDNETLKLEENQLKEVFVKITTKDRKVYFSNKNRQISTKSK